LTNCCRPISAGQTLVHGDQFISLYPAAGVPSLPAINGAYGIIYTVAHNVIIIYFATT